jgi:hypothetical protein
MKNQKPTGSEEVTLFLANLTHPLMAEIQLLRQMILSANPILTEHIKWNAPSFCQDGEDRITMRVHPPKQIQLIFHRGAKVQELPKNPIIVEKTGILAWKTTDRAVATFENLTEIASKKSVLVEIINDWLAATKGEFFDK